MTKSQLDVYQDTATHALAGFQLIEQSLKDYIMAYHLVLDKVITGKMVYEFDEAEVVNAPLGHLCSRFEKLTENKALVAEIRRLIPKRDYLAHRALKELYGDKISEDDASGKTDEFEQVAEAIGELLKKIRDEQLKLLTVLKSPKVKNSSKKDAASGASS